MILDSTETLKAYRTRGQRWRCGFCNAGIGHIWWECKQTHKQGFWQKNRRKICDIMKQEV